RVIKRRLARLMIQPRFPKWNLVIENILTLFRRQQPRRRRIFATVLLRLNEVLRRAVNGEIKRRFGGKRFDATRRFGVRGTDNKIDMRLFVYVVKKWKCGRENKNTQRRKQAKREDNPAEFFFGQSHGDTGAKRCSTTVSVPCSVIRGAAPLFSLNVASISSRYGEFVS